jgi:hypothetical protein
MTEAHMHVAATLLERDIVVYDERTPKGIPGSLLYYKQGCKETSSAINKEQAHSLTNANNMKLLWIHLTQGHWRPSAASRRVLLLCVLRQGGRTAVRAAHGEGAFACASACAGATVCIICLCLSLRLCTVALPLPHPSPLLPYRSTPDPHTYVRGAYTARAHFNHRAWRLEYRGATAQPRAHVWPSMRMW